MKRTAILLLHLLLVVSAVYGDVAANLSDYLSRMEAFGFSGSVTVTRKGQTVFERAYGFADREKVSVIVHHADAKRPWSDLRGLLSGEEGEEFARVIEEAFPIEPVKK